MEVLKINIHKVLKSSNLQVPMHFELEIPIGTITGVFGESGSGKTTFLKLLSGLDQPDSGCILNNGQPWFDSKTICAPAKRRIGFVFQDPSLFSHFTVLENLLFGAPHDEQSKEEIEKILSNCGILQFKNKYPNELSMGQKQRVALARVMAQNADFVFLDEPFSALDSASTKELTQVLLNYQKRVKNTLLFVSHNPMELVRTCEKTIHITQGKVDAYDLTKKVVLQANKSENLVTGEVCLVNLEHGYVEVVVGHQLVKIKRNAQQLGSLQVGDVYSFNLE